MSEIGAPKTGLMNIGTEAKPPFAVLPDPSTLFLVRSKRLTALAQDHQLQRYLTFVSVVSRVQHDIQKGLSQPHRPAAERLAQAREHGMPPISRALFEPDDVVQASVALFLEQVAAADVPLETRVAIDAARAALPDGLHEMCRAALREPGPSDNLAMHALITAGLQVHFARSAAQLSVEDLKPVADGVCPACGSPPMVSSVVGWPNAHNTRFCTCSLCATMWNVVRVKCVLCSSTEGISYQSIEGAPSAIKAETCDKCRHYVKILYQVNDAALEPFADDVGSVGLDMLLADEGWKRGGHNPFLLGY